MRLVGSRSASDGGGGGGSWGLFCGLLSVIHTRHKVPASMVLADHGSVYGTDALLTSPAHRGVVRRRTSPGRSEDVGARDLRRGSRGQTPTPRPGRRRGCFLVNLKDWQSAVSTQQESRGRGSKSNRRLGTSGRNVCLCGYPRCFWIRNMYPVGLVCALFSVLSVLSVLLFSGIIGLTGTSAELQPRGTGHALDRQARRYSAHRPTSSSR